MQTSIRTICSSISPDGSEIIWIDSRNHRKVADSYLLGTAGSGCLATHLGGTKLHHETVSEAFEMDNVAVTFDKEAYEYIVDKAVEFKLGARDCVRIVEQS